MKHVNRMLLKQKDLMHYEITRNAFGQRLVSHLSYAELGLVFEVR